MPEPASVQALVPAPDRPRSFAAGIGLKAEFYREILEHSPPVGWFEVHPENYMIEGGPPLKYLDAIRRDYPLSLHGVGMSLGSSEAPDRDHLDRLARLIDRFEPFVISEHLSWSRTGEVFFADLLPLPLTHRTLAIVESNVGRAQDHLGRQLLLENPSAYVQFECEEIPEPEFMNEVSRRTGCGILLDVNNLFVSASNLGFDPNQWLDAVDSDAVGEIHLAGHAVDEASGKPIRIDDHGWPVPACVFELYRDALRRCGPVPTLIERDANLPPLQELLSEVQLAEQVARETLQLPGCKPSACLHAPSIQPRTASGPVDAPLASE